MLPPEETPLLVAAGFACVAFVVFISVWVLLTDWRVRRSKLKQQRQKALSRGTHPLRNVDRFDTWQEAMSWYYLNDRHIEDPHDHNCSAAFLAWLFAPLPEKLK